MIAFRTTIPSTSQGLISVCVLYLKVSMFMAVLLAFHFQCFKKSSLSIIVSLILEFPIVDQFKYLSIHNIKCIICHNSDCDCPLHRQRYNQKLRSARSYLCLCFYSFNFVNRFYFYTNSLNFSHTRTIARVSRWQYACLIFIGNVCWYYVSFVF